VVESVKKVREEVFMKKLTLTLGILFLASIAYGGAFIKGGIILNPDVGGISERWLASIGSDYYIDMIGLGLEIQSAYHGSDVVTAVPLNGFVNLKVKPQLSGLTPVVGIGFGLMSNVIWGEEIDLDFNKHGGMHFIGGFEFGMEHGPALAVEFQALRPFASDAKFSYVILGGIRF
jgi:hypothetical protein